MLELKFVSVLLLVIFAFDLATWSLLFNSLFHASAKIFDRDGLTVLAILSALMVATAVTIFERQFFCADITTHWVRGGAAFLVRLGVIAASAFVTAQPVELLTFHGPIARRSHEEAVLREVVSRETQVKEEEDKAAKAQREKENAGVSVKNTSAGSEFQTAVSATTAAEGRANAAIVALQQSLANITAYQQRVSDAQTRIDLRRAGLEQQRARGVDTTAAQELLSAAQREKSYWQRLLEDARAQAARNRDLVKETGQQASDSRAAETPFRIRRDQEEKRIRDEHQTDQALAEKRRNDLRTYVDDVKKFGLTRNVESRLAHDGAGAPQPFRYHYESGDVFQQLEILEDLKQGRPARWPMIDAQTRSKLAATYALDDPAVVTAEELARRADSAALYQHAYKIAFIIALVIPVLVMATKILLAGELAAYYSLHRQAESGNPDAIAVVRTMPPRRSLGERLTAIAASIKAAGTGPQPG
jgi:hypothetical protein